MRIAMLLSNGFRPDPRVHKEARSLAQAGHEVTVICWDRTGEFAPNEHLDGFEVRRIAIRSGYSAGSRQILHLPRFWGAALRQLYSLDPDVVHCHDLDTAPAGYFYALYRRIPWILDAHECYPEEVKGQVDIRIYRGLLWLERVMARSATQVLTVGEMLADYFRAMGARVAIVGNYQALKPQQNTGAIRRDQLGFGEADFVVAYAGGFTHDRAILPLIEATDIASDARVLLLGDGPQRPAIEAAVQDRPRVHYCGWVPQAYVPAYTALADVVYYGLNSDNGNSRYSTPNSLFNALAAAKPVLTTDIGEIARIVRDEGCGVVIDRPTPSAIAGAIAQLRDRSVRETLGQNAARAARSKYNWDVAAGKLLEVYRTAGQ